MHNGIHEQVTQYLTDAHSIEEQALQQLRKAPDLAGDERFAAILKEHLQETEEHERRVRELLEARGAAPSGVKDTVLRATGQGFVLFARSQTDTPGKLAAHAFSYEALEWASYDLLARTAEAAGETEVATAARSIREEERRMIERIEALFDRTADASLRAGEDGDIRDRLRTYLADAHAIEAQSIQLLQSGRKMVDDATLSALFEDHLSESRRHQEILEERLDALDGKESWFKDAAMRFGALNWGMFFGAQPDTTGKLAAFAYAFEHLEIGGYEQLRRVAVRAGDEATVRDVDLILEEERSAAGRLVRSFDEAVASVL